MLWPFHTWGLEYSWPKFVVHGTIKGLPAPMKRRCRPEFCQGPDGPKNSGQTEERSPFAIQVSTELEGAILDP